MHPPTGMDWFLYCNADASDDFDAYGEFARLADGHDLIIGARTYSEDRRHMTVPQRFGNWLAPALIQAFWDTASRTSGPSAIRIAAFRKLDLLDRGFGWTVEMQIRAIEEGLRMVEIPCAPSSPCWAVQDLGHRARQRTGRGDYSQHHLPAACASLDADAQARGGQHPVSDTGRDWTINRLRCVGPKRSYRHSWDTLRHRRLPVPLVHLCRNCHSGGVVVTTLSAKRDGAPCGSSFPARVNRARLRATQGNRREV